MVSKGLLPVCPMPLARWPLRQRLGTPRLLPELGSSCCASMGEMAPQVLLVLNRLDHVEGVLSNG